MFFKMIDALQTLVVQVKCQQDFHYIDRRHQGSSGNSSSKSMSNQEAMQDTSLSCRQAIYLALIY